MLEDQGRPTDSLPFEGNIFFDPVGNLDERHAPIHPILLWSKAIAP